jgi:cytochrome c oxidase subunit 4
MTGTRETVLTWLALLVLLALTAGSSRLDLGWANSTINLVIAVAKAALIAVVFMQLRRRDTLVRLVTGAAIVWLLILYSLTLVDYASR